MIENRTTLLIWLRPHHNKSPRVSFLPVAVGSTTVFFDQVILVNSAHSVCAKPEFGKDIHSLARSF